MQLGSFVESSFQVKTGQTGAGEDRNLLDCNVLEKCFPGQPGIDDISIHRQCKSSSDVSLIRLGQVKSIMYSPKTDTINKSTLYNGKLKKILLGISQIEKKLPKDPKSKAVRDIFTMKAEQATDYIGIEGGILTTSQNIKATLGPILGQRVRTFENINQRKASFDLNTTNSSKVQKNI